MCRLKKKTTQIPTRPIDMWRGEVLMVKTPQLPADRFSLPTEPSKGGICAESDTSSRDSSIGAISGVCAVVLWNKKNRTNMAR